MITVPGGGELAFNQLLGAGRRVTFIGSASSAGFYNLLSHHGPRASRGMGCMTSITSSGKGTNVQGDLASSSEHLSENAMQWRRQQAHIGPQRLLATHNTGKTVKTLTRTTHLWGCCWGSSSLCCHAISRDFFYDWI